MAEKTSIGEKFLPKIKKGGPKSIAEPEKELRFTRARQAYLFFALSVIFFAAAMAFFILSTQDWGMDGPLLKGLLWVCVPTLLMTFLCIRLGLHCVRHAYMILSPLGLEIFPFFKPEKNLQIIYWAQIHEVDIDAKKMTIHFTEEKTSGIVASLAPILKSRRTLLKTAVTGVIDSR